MEPGIKETLYYGLSGKLAKIYTLEFSKKWQEKRLSLGIKERTIAYDDKESRDYFTPCKLYCTVYSVRGVKAGKDITCNLEIILPPVNCTV